MVNPFLGATGPKTLHGIRVWPAERQQMSRDGHTLGWEATGVLATEHLSLERGHNTSQLICVCACVQLLSCVFLLFVRRWPLVPPVLFHLFGVLYAFITELTVEIWLEMKRWRNRDGTKVLGETRLQFMDSTLNPAVKGCPLIPGFKSYFYHFCQQSNLEMIWGNKHYS